MPAPPPLALSLLGAVAFALWPHHAGAASNAQLVYARSTDAASCPDEEALRAAVMARVGYDPFFPWASRKVIAAMTKRGRAFVASVELVDEQGFTHGVHELRTQSECAELLDTVALAIAIAIDPRLLVSAAPVAAQAQSEPMPVPPPPPPPAPALESLPPPPDTRPVVERGGARFEGSAGVVGTAGAAPSPSVGAALGVGLRWTTFSLGVEGRVDAPATGDAPAGGSVSSWLVLGAIVPCAHLGAFFACGLAEAGVMESSSSGVVDHRSTSLAWWAAGGRVGAFVPLGRDLRLRLRGDLVADLDPATLDLHGSGAWMAPPVAASLGVDAVVRFR